jgi:hypothetical protein
MAFSRMLFSKAFTAEIAENAENFKVFSAISGVLCGKMVLRHYLRGVPSFLENVMDSTRGLCFDLIESSELKLALRRGLI